MENRTNQKVSIRIKAGWSGVFFRRYGKTCVDRYLPMSVKRKVFNQSALEAIIYGY